jgi:Uma2 family endonuclease
MQLAIPALPVTRKATPVVKVMKSRWPLAGQWTYEDYLQLPDDGIRYEIIDGVLYMANAPGYPHQFTVAKLLTHLSVFVDQRQLGIVLTAPFEIHLSATSKPVQPDVFFIAAARPLKYTDKFFAGAPELIVEVISPSSIRLDRAIKLAAYERAGVREYWLADPRLRVVEVYTLAAGVSEYALYGQFGLGEQVCSLVLPELVLAVESLFVP